MAAPSAPPIRLAVDCMGGDHGPSITLPACRAFLSAHPAAELVLVGRADALQAAAGWERCTRVDATEVVEMSDSVEVALRKKKDSSLRVAVSQVKPLDDRRNAPAPPPECERLLPRPQGIEDEGGRRLTLPRA